MCQTNLPDSAVISLDAQQVFNQIEWEYWFTFLKNLNISSWCLFVMTNSSCSKTAPKHDVATPMLHSWDGVPMLTGSPPLWALLFSNTIRLWAVSLLFSDGSYCFLLFSIFNLATYLLEFWYALNLAGVFELIKAMFLWPSCHSILCSCGTARRTINNNVIK